jgi:hypothetical protein
MLELVLDEDQSPFPLSSQPLQPYFKAEFCRSSTESKVLLQYEL